MPRYSIALASLRFLTILLAVLLAPAVQSSAPGKLGRSDAPQGLAGLPLDAQAVISASLGEDQPAYHARREGATLHLDNPAHGIKARFTAQGLALQSGGASLGLQMQGVGYGTYIQPLPATEPQMQANRIEYRRGDIREWYINGPAGLEQGFTLARPPAEATGEALTLTLALNGDLRAQSAAEGLDLVHPDGRLALHYGGLTAYDAGGRSLPIWWQGEGKTVSLRVDDRGARYPVTIDPFFQQAKLTSSDGSAGARFGISVAASGDTLVVGKDGGPFGNDGSAYVFIKPAGGWRGAFTERAKLTSSDGGGNFEYFGSSVAVAGDTVVVGATGGCIRGSAYVFVRPVGGWSGSLTENAKLTAADQRASACFGNSVAMNADTVVVGAYAENNHQGSAYVFIRPLGGWNGALNESAKLIAAKGTENNNFGFSVAISADKVVVGAYGENSVQGSAYMFTRPPGGWSGTLNESAQLIPAKGMTNNNFGLSVAISGDTVVIGSAYDYQSSAYVFVKPGGGWSGLLSENAQLTVPGGWEQIISSADLWRWRETSWSSVPLESTAVEIPTKALLTYL